MSDGTHYILNALQAGMLAEIAARSGQCTFDNVQYLLGISRTTAQREMRELRDERGFVASVRKSCENKMLHSLTPEGQHALDAHQRRMARECGGQASMASGCTVAKRSTASLFDAPAYRPAADRAYYRNNGNAHIASRGLRC